MFPIPHVSGRFRTFKRASLGSELLAWWCALLAVLLATFLWAGYRAVEGTLLKAGGERAHVAAQQLALLVGRSAQARNEQLAFVAGEEAIRHYVQAPTPSNLVAARELALTLATPAPHRIAVWNAAGDQLFEVAAPASGPRGTSSAVFPAAFAPTQVGSGALHVGNDVVFSQSAAAITQPPGSGSGAVAGTVLGYVVVRAVVADQRGALAINTADLIGRLVGTEATMALGNTTGDVWTDLSRMVPAPPVDLTVERVTEYAGGGAPRIGALVPVANSPWAVWVEFPSRALVAPARTLLRTGIFLALGCLVVGAGLVAAVIARSTRPFGELAAAARAIADGDYARRVGSRRRNEIGQLADSFNVMADRIDTAYQALRNANDRTQFALAAARMGVWEVDLSSSHVSWSAAMAAVYGLTPDTAPRTLDAVLGCIHPADRALVSEALAARRDYHLEFRVVWPDETIHWVSSRAQIRRGDKDSPVRLLGVSVDITARKTLEDALFAEKERAEVTLHSIGDAVISTAVTGKVAYLNGAAERLTGWSSAEAVGRPLLDVLHIIDATTRVPADDPGARAMRLQRTVDLGDNCRLIRRDGSTALVEDSASPIHDRDGKVTGAVIVFRDVTAERAQALKMVRLAQYDVLTGLPNRTLFNDRIVQATAVARRNGTRLAVLFVDLDRFKHVNDSLGHALGDALLRSVTIRLLASVRASDTVGRRGGDEFVLLLAELDRPDSAGVVADKIITAIAEPHEILDRVVHITASVGIGIYPDDASDAEALIAAADTAMYHAKEAGRGSSQYFTSEMNARSIARRSLEDSLRQALRLREFVLHYQPKVELATSAIAGIEALIRWRHPTRGLLAPAEFVSVAEECGLIQPMGRWVLREACRQARAWQEDGLPAVIMSVNVSAGEFRAKGFIDHVAAVLRETKLAPEYLELELTESVLMAQAEATTSVLRALKDLGVRLAIDDFGTGYSSLSYLSRFPIDTLKIDRSFVHGLTTTGHDAAIINAIIAMGSSLNQCVVAEGVETAEQLQMLRHHLCDQGQGYFFSRPVAAGQLADLLRCERPLRSIPSPSYH